VCGGQALHTLALYSHACAASELPTRHNDRLGCQAHALSFSDDGKATIPFGANDDCSSIAQQTDGKLVLAGTRADGSGDLAVARLNPDGTRDTSFDGDGKLTTSFGGYDEFGATVALQSDGRIVVLGNRGVKNQLDSSFIARYLPNGALDGTFGSGGKLSIAGDRLFELALQPGGKLLMSGYREFVDAAPTPIVRRLLPSGAPDNTLSGDSAVEFGLAGRNYDFGFVLALRPDGRILFADIEYLYSNSRKRSVDMGQLWQLWPDGTVSNGGQQTHSLTFPPEYRAGYHETVNGMALQADNSMVVAGQVYDPDYSHSVAFITRFMFNGQPDTSFGVNGSAFVGPGKFSSAQAVAVQSDGKIVIAGYADFSTNRTIMAFLVARFNPDGTPDLSFGYKGSYITYIAGGPDAATALAIAPDGKIVVAGNVWNGVRYDWGVLRLTSSGQADTSFDADGLFTFGFGFENGLNAVAIQPDGKILLAGHTARNFTVARLLPDGLIDSSFGNSGGFAFNDLGGTDIITALALARNGWIYAAGYRVQDRNGDMALAQYTPDGILASCADTTTCANWPTGTFFVDAGINDYAYALDLRDDNQLVAAGYSNQYFAAVQVRTNGTPTPLAFNTDFAGSPDCAKAVQFVDYGDYHWLVMAGDQDSYPHSQGSNIAMTRFVMTSRALASESQSNQEANTGSETGAEQEPSGDVNTASDAEHATPSEGDATAVDAASDAETGTPSEDATTNMNDIQP